MHRLGKVAPSREERSSSTCSQFGEDVKEKLRGHKMNVQAILESPMLQEVFVAHCRKTMCEEASNDPCYLMKIKYIISMIEVTSAMDLYYQALITCNILMIVFLIA